MEASWEPQLEVTFDEIREASDTLLHGPAIPIRDASETLVFESLGLQWELAVEILEPEALEALRAGPDGRAIGVLLLHGGMGDHREKRSVARFLAERFGYRVVLMSYPGRYYFLDPAGNWPGDTINSDGSVRTPLWHHDEQIGRDEYDVVRDRSDPVKRAKWGTLTFAAARRGTPFFDRMAAWPAAFEDALTLLASKYLPQDRFSIYVHGHSTGGPFAHMILQRVPNIAGLLGAETSSFAYIYQAGLGMTWTHPFNYLAIMSWRNIAMYRGPEAGPELQWRLPWVMEDVLAEWEAAKSEPYFKAEYMLTYAAAKQLGSAARAVSNRLRMTAGDEVRLVRRYIGYTRELAGPTDRRVPPLLLGIVRGSRDHTRERYERVVLPMLSAIRPAPKVCLVQYDYGVHVYDAAAPGLPLGVFPAIARTWDDAIHNGFFLPLRTTSVANRK